MRDFKYKLFTFMGGKKSADEIWYNYLTGEWHKPFPENLKRGQFFLNLQRNIYDLLPSESHCSHCGIPMTGIWGNALRFLGSAPATFSPRLCNGCEVMARYYESGAEVELSMIFADVRDSTPLAEEMGPVGFKEIINRFYKETSRKLIEHNAMVNRLMGDQVIALFVPRFVGENHARVALEAAQDILRVTGHGDENGPWVPVGAGVHTGSAYVGVVGSADAVTEVTVLGSAANMCARLSSKAAAGEILISEDSLKSGNLDVDGLASRSLELKGVRQPVSAKVVKV